MRRRDALKSSLLGLLGLGAVKEAVAAAEEYNGDPEWAHLWLVDGKFYSARESGTIPREVGDEMRASERLGQTFREVMRIPAGKYDRRYTEYCLAVHAVTYPAKTVLGTKLLAHTDRGLVGVTMDQGRAIHWLRTGELPRE